jgi:ribokinase
MRTAYAGRIGKDWPGKAMIESFKRSEVSCNYIISDEGAITPTATVLVEQGSGRRTPLLDPGHGCELSAGEVPTELLKGTSAVHLDGRHPELQLSIAERARKHGVATFLDVGSARDGAAPLLPFIDHLVVASEFARYHSGTRSVRLATRHLWQDNMETLTITLGKQSSVGLDGTSFFRQPSVPIEVVDTTGAGDAFHGGYIYGILNGMSLPATLRCASAVAALNCRALGGREGLPTVEEVDEILESGECR